MSESQAWAYLLQWKGGVELLARTARAATWAFRDEGVTDPVCRVDVNVDGDWESFDSPDDFRDHVTTHALHRFGWVMVTVHGADAELAIVMVRKPETEDDWPPRGVLLEVLSNGGNEQYCARVRDRIVAALNRGRPRDAPPALTGPGDNSAACVAVREWQEKSLAKPQIPRPTTVGGWIRAMRSALVNAFWANSLDRRRLEMGGASAQVRVLVRRKSASWWIRYGLLSAVYGVVYAGVFAVLEPGLRGVLGVVMAVVFAGVGLLIAYRLPLSAWISVAGLQRLPPWFGKGVGLIATPLVGILLARLLGAE